MKILFSLRVFWASALHIRHYGNGNGNGNGNAHSNKDSNNTEKLKRRKELSSSLDSVSEQ